MSIRSWIILSIILVIIVGCSTNSKHRSLMSSTFNNGNDSNVIEQSYNDENADSQPFDIFRKIPNANIRVISTDQVISVGKQYITLAPPYKSDLASFDTYLTLNGFGIRPAYALYRIGPFKSDAKPSQLDINFSGVAGQNSKLNYAIYYPMQSIWKWYSTSVSKVHPISYGNEWLYNYKGKKYLYIVFATGKEINEAVNISSIMLTAVTYKAPTKADWNILFYIAGDNNLAQYAVDNLNQAEQIGSTDNINILAQYDINAPTILNTDKVWRIKVLKDFNSKAINVENDSRNVSFSKAGFDSSSPKNLYDFLTWTKSNFPANHTCLILWDHGGGWLPGHTQNRVTTSILGDDTDGPNGGELADNTTIAEAIKKSALPIDVIYFDACNMGHLEALYDFKDTTPLIIGSQLLVPGYGGNYHDWLNKLILSPSMDPLTLCNNAVDSYYYQYTTKYQLPCSLAVYDTSKVDDLANTILNLGTSLISYKESEQNRFKSAISASYYDQFEESNGSRDLMDFIKYMKSSDNTTILNLLKDVEKYYTLTVLYQKHPNLTKSNGITLFLPDQFSLNSNDYLYENIAFNKTTKWLSVLQSLGTPSDNNAYELTEKVYDGWKVKIYWDKAVDLDLWCYEPSLSWWSPKLGSSTDYCNYSPDTNGVNGKEESLTFKLGLLPNKYYIAVEYPPEQTATEKSQFWAQIIDNESNVIKTIGPRTINSGETYNIFELLKQ